MSRGSELLAGDPCLLFRILGLEFASESDLLILSKSPVRNPSLTYCSFCKEKISSLISLPKRVIFSSLSFITFIVHVCEYKYVGTCATVYLWSS